MLRMVLFFGLLLPGCLNKQEYREEELYHDYQITGEEGASQVSILVQFRVRNSYGSTVELLPGTGIQLDGVALELDNSTQSGPMYVASRPLNEFKGPHQLVYTDTKGKKWKQDLNYPVVYLGDESIFSKAVDSAGFSLQILAEPAVKKLRVLMTDTSYAGKEFDKIILLNQDHLEIKSRDLGGFKPGPIQLELIAEYHRNLGGKNQPGGALSLTYTLRREFLWAGLPDSSRRP